MYKNQQQASGTCASGLSGQCDFGKVLCPCWYLGGWHCSVPLAKFCQYLGGWHCSVTLAKFRQYLGGWHCSVTLAKFCQYLGGWHCSVTLAKYVVLTSNLGGQHCSVTLVKCVVPAGTQSTPQCDCRIKCNVIFCGQDLGFATFSYIFDCWSWHQCRMLTGYVQHTIECRLQHNQSKLHWCAQLWLYMPHYLARASQTQTHNMAYWRCSFITRENIRGNRG